MRASRLTYPGARHYIKHRGIPGDDIFFINRDKVEFLELMKLYASQMEIKVLAYCIMNNDVQLVVENTNGRMSDFFKNLFSKYSSVYRKHNGGKGVVFHDRYYSAVIQDDEYLKQSIAYVLLTPVRENLVETAEEYLWSNAGAYFEQKESDLVDLNFVRLLFGRKIKMFHLNHSQLPSSLPIVRSNEGHIIGEEPFLAEALEKYRQSLDPKP